MPQYVVERHLPNFTGEQIAAAAKSAKESSSEMTREGTPVRYLRSIFIPGEDKCFASLREKTLTRCSRPTGGLSCQSKKYQRRYPSQRKRLPRFPG